MSPPSNEPPLELTFECGLGNAKRTEFPGLRFLRLEALSIPVARSAPGNIGIQSGVSILGFNLEGSIVVRAANVEKVVIVPPRSLFFVRGPMRLSALAARGEHRLQMISWPVQAVPSLETWLQGLSARNTKEKSRLLGCKPIDPDFVEVVKRFEYAKTAGNDLIEPLLMSVIYEAVGRIMIGGDQMQLSPLPSDMPEPLRKLSEAVRQNPAGNWSLKEASEMASYSPFHFSRVFKQVAGYGFHEFVDRCRTELAVELLVSSDIAVDNVATNSGFGTTQGMRESVRDYLGLVPSEFRSLPEIYE